MSTQHGQLPPLLLTNWRVFWLFISSHVSPAQGRGARRSELLLCYTGRDGKGHQGGPLPGARRVWRQPLRHQDRLHPRGGGRRPHLHPGRQPSGLSDVLTLRNCFGLDCVFSTQALKVLKTAEFMPFVVFIAAPELDTLRAMHKAVVDAGLTTKLLTVCFQVHLGAINLSPLRSGASQ